MVRFDPHIILPIMAMGHVWWLFSARYLIDLTCMLIAVKDFSRLFRIISTTLLMNIAVYTVSTLIVEGLFAYSNPRLDVLGLGLRPLWASLEAALQPGMGSITFTLLAVFFIAVAVNFIIQYSIAHASFPDVDCKRLKIYILLASLIAVALSVRVVYLREAKRIAFIEAIEQGLINIDKDAEEIELSNKFQDYERTGLDPADVKDKEIKAYRLESHLREVVNAYAKEARQSAKKRK